jgi:LysM repeat protein
MQEQLAGHPNALKTETVLKFLTEARATGATVGDVRQREQLRAILRHWGGIIYDRSGDYPAIQLAPFEGQSISELPSEVEVFDPPPRRWPRFFVGAAIFLALIAVVMIALSLLGYQVGAIFSSITNTLDGGSAEGIVTPPTEIVAEAETVVITATPLPSATTSPTAANVDASGDDDDSDGDGLTDEEEADLGTNPFAEDSDGDGLWDIDELNFGTDPLNFDSDGDGLSDGVDGDPGRPPTFTPTPLPTATPLPPTATATPQTAVPHTVQAGETLEAIAEQYGVSATQIAELNGLSLQERLQEGQELFIPLNPGFIVPEMVIKLTIVNLRSGPGIEYTIIAYPKRGTFATILGQTADPTWYLVELQDGSGTRGWLSAAVVRLLYPTRPETIPLAVTVPPTPGS